MSCVLSLTYSSQFNSVTQSCPTLCDSMDCSTPGFLVHHQLPEFAQIHAIQPSHPLFSSLLPSIFPSIRVFSNIEASASVLPINNQDWFPLGSTGLISLQSKGCSGVFSTVQKHQFFNPTLTTIHDYWKNHSFD